MLFKIQILVGLENISYIWFDHYLAASFCALSRTSSQLNFPSSLTSILSNKSLSSESPTLTPFSSIPFFNSSKSINPSLLVSNSSNYVLISVSKKYHDIALTPPIFFYCPPDGFLSPPILTLAGVSIDCVFYEPPQQPPISTYYKIKNKIKNDN